MLATKSRYRSILANGEAKALTMSNFVPASQHTSFGVGLTVAQDGCRSAWCVAYEIQEVGGIDLATTIDVKLQLDVGG